MDTCFSESTYANAATREVEGLLEKHGQILLTAPQIPSLRAERTLGYDVRIDATSIAVVLQFKTGEYISRSHVDSTTWPQAAQPHYRVHFPAGHHQLPILQRLEDALVLPGSSNLVRYLAPAFWEERDLTSHYLNREVLAHSYGCRPSDVPVDGAGHYLIRVPALGGRPAKSIMLSEPIELPEFDFERAIEGAAPEGFGAPERLDDEPRNAIALSVQRTFEVLNSEAEYRGVDVAILRERSGEGFDDRPALAFAVFVVSLAEALGIWVGFTAQVRARI